MNESTLFDWPAGSRWQRRLLIGGLLGAAVCGLGAFLDSGQVLRSYLFAYFSCLGFAD